LSPLIRVSSCINEGKVASFMLLNNCRGCLSVTYGWSSKWLIVIIVVGCILHLLLFRTFKISSIYGCTVLIVSDIYTDGSYNHSIDG
jgi:hypothetical protein